MQGGLGCEVWPPQGLSEVFSQVQVQGRGRPKRAEDGVRELGVGRLSLQDPHVAHLCLMNGLSHLSRHPPPRSRLRARS